MTRTCVTCRTRLDPAVPDDRHPLCALDPPPTVDEIRTALVLLGGALGIEAVADEGADHRGHHRAAERGDHRDAVTAPITGVCPECDRAVPPGVVRHAPCYRRHVDALHRAQPHRTGYRIRPSDFRTDQPEETR